MRGKLREDKVVNGWGEGGGGEIGTLFNNHENLYIDKNVKSGRF